MDKEEIDNNVPAGLSLTLGEDLSNKEPLNFKTLLERFYQLTFVDEKEEPGQGYPSDFLQGGANK